MVKVVGIRFRNAGKIYYFGPGKLQLKAGMHVIVETARGVEMGTVMTDPREVSEESVVQPLKPVIRIATEQDEKQAEKNRQKEKEAFKICLEKIAKHKLDMKLVEAEYTFDNNKLLFYFTADGRIDFREFLKRVGLMPTGFAHPTPAAIMHKAPSGSKWRSGFMDRRPISLALESPNFQLISAWADSWNGMTISMATARRA